MTDESSSSGASWRVVAIDSGSSLTKVYDGERSLVFPSLAAEVPKADHGHFADELVVDGRHYAVGETYFAAENEPNAKPHLDAEFHGSQEQHIHLCYALALLGADGPYDQLILSLPYTDSRNEALRERLKARKRFAYQFTTDGGSTFHEHAVTFGAVRILPQGVGALEYYQKSLNGGGGFNVVTLVDIGSCTTDIVTIYKNRVTGKLDYHLRASRSDREISVTRFYDQWYARLRQLPGLQGRDLDYHSLMSRAREGRWELRHDGTIHNIKSQFDETAREFTRTLAHRVQTTTKSLWHETERIVFTGGGAHLLDNEAWPPSAPTHVLALLANVMGQYQAAGGR